MKHAGRRPAISFRGAQSPANGRPLRRRPAFAPGGAPARRVRRFNLLWSRVKARAEKAAPSLADLQFRDLRRTFHSLTNDAGVGGVSIAAATGNNSHRDARLSRT